MGKGGVKNPEKLPTSFMDGPWAGTQRAKIAEKVHKPPLGVDVINLNLMGLMYSYMVPWSPSDTNKL